MSEVKFENRRLAWKSVPGVVHDESAWVKSRQNIYGETWEKAVAEVKALVDKGDVIVVDKKE